MKNSSKYFSVNIQQRTISIASMCILLMHSFFVSAQQRIITIDPSQLLPPIELIIGTNAGPMAQRSSADYTLLFKELGIQAIRTHDYYGPCDWMEIYPDWNADPNIASSYHFASSDAVIYKIYIGGFEILYRLGSSWRGNRPAYSNDPPGTIRDASGTVTHVADANDFAKFAEICKHIVMHYNQGWSNGYRYNIRRWEIWNEPSLKEQFWTGTPIQFHQMFSIVAKTLKGFDASLMIGGPGQAGNSTRAYFQDLFDYSKKNNTPIDFYSYHSYGGTRAASSPWDLGKKAIEARSVLNTNGYTATKLFCDEFNAEGDSANYANTGRGAAFYAAALTYLTENGVRESYQYRADDHPLGLVMQNGSTKIAAESFKAWKELVKLPDRILATGTDTLGFTIIATKSMWGDSIRVLIANFPPTTKQLLLQFDHLPAPTNSQWRFVRRVIDNTKRLEKLDSTKLTAVDSFSQAIDIAGESVQFIELQRITISSLREIDSPNDVSLEQNFPNPFAQSTAIAYRLQASGFVRLEVFDMLGRKVATLVDEEKEAGEYNSKFKIQDSSAFGGFDLPAGIYFYRLTTKDFSETKKFIINKIR